uniref:CSON012204 protein n=1 Tax=Culicoides sonorensis TaxID=179676 RepID=A0A336KVJ5_CULSO
MDLITSFELLFFAVFGQTTTDQIIVDKYDERFKEGRTQPVWTDYLFKVVFGIYMLVSVIVLINLLIAMMSDTYQRIQAQSDTEWKFGLSKLIRNMFRTTTEAPPMNLITTWLKWLIKNCRECKVGGFRFGHKKAKKIEVTRYFGKASARTKAAAKWIEKTERTAKALQETLVASNVSLKGKLSRFAEPKTKQVYIENVIDWVMIANKFREIVGDVENFDTSSSQEGKDEEEEGGTGQPANGVSHQV